MVTRDEPIEAALQSLRKGIVSREPSVPGGIPSQCCTVLAEVQFPANETSYAQHSRTK